MHAPDWDASLRPRYRNMPDPIDTADDSNPALPAAIRLVDHRGDMDDYFEIQVIGPYPDTTTRDTDLARLLALPNDGSYQLFPDRIGSITADQTFAPAQFADATTTTGFHAAWHGCTEAEYLADDTNHDPHDPHPDQMTIAPRRIKVPGNLYTGTVPDTAIYVGRRTRRMPASPYANPHRLGDCTTCHQQHHDRASAVTAYAKDLAAQPELVAAARRDLAGRDLACWCKTDDLGPCHADILLMVVAGWDPQAAAQHRCELAANLGALDTLFSALLEGQ